MAQQGIDLKIKSIGWLARNALVYSLGPWSQRALGLILVPVYTRVFAPEVFGVVAVMTVTLQLMRLGLGLGIDSATVRFYRDTSDVGERKRLATTALLARLAAITLPVLVLLPFAGLLSRLLFGSEGYSDVVRLALGALPFATLLVFCQYLFQSNFRSWAYTFTSLGHLASNAGLTLWFILGLDLGVAGIFWAQFIVNAGFAVIALLAVRQYLSISLSLDRVAKLLKYGLPLVPAGLALFVIQMSDRYFLVYFTDLREVGLYGIAASLASVVALITAGFSPIWSPFVYSVYGQSNAPATFAKVFDLYATAVLAMVLVLSVFAIEILHVLTTPAYLAAYLVVPLLVFGAGIYAIGDYFPVGIAIAKKTKHRAWIGMAGAATNIVLNLALIPTWGMLGAAIATVISFLVLGSLLMWKSQAFYFVPYKFARHLTLWTAAALLVGGTYYFDSPEVSIQTVAWKALALGAFATLPFLLGLIKWGDIIETVRLTGLKRKNPPIPDLVQEQATQ